MDAGQQVFVAKFYDYMFTSNIPYTRVEAATFLSLDDEAGVVVRIRSRVESYDSSNVFNTRAEAGRYLIDKVRQSRLTFVNSFDAEIQRLEADCGCSVA